MEIGLHEVIMRWVIFLSGLLTFIFSVWRRNKEGSGPQLLALLGIPGSLMVIALFAPVIASIELGPAKVTMKAEKAAVTTLVEKQPKVAETLTGEKGTKAVQKAIEKIEEVKKPEDLQKIIPFIKQQDAIYFFPPDGNRAYKVQPAIGTTSGSVQTLELRTSGD